MNNKERAYYWQNSIAQWTKSGLSGAQYWFFVRQCKSLVTCCGVDFESAVAKSHGETEANEKPDQVQTLSMENERHRYHSRSILLCLAEQIRPCQPSVQNGRYNIRPIHVQNHHTRASLYKIKPTELGS